MTADIKAADDDGSVDRISLYGFVHDGEASERDKVIQVVALLVCEGVAAAGEDTDADGTGPGPVPA